jgi:hypothetical protein
MGTRGRKSAEELNLVCIDVQKQRLTPPDFLTAKEAEIFTSIVDSSDAKPSAGQSFPCSAPTYRRLACRAGMRW